MDLLHGTAGMRFEALARARHQAMLSELARRGLQDLGQPMILILVKQLGKNGQVAAQRELADALRVSPATIAVSLKSLAKAGYIERRAHESDQRRRMVAITPHGEWALEECRAAFVAVDASTFPGFSSEELALLDSYHRRMLTNLRGTLPQKGDCCPC